MWNNAVYLSKTNKNIYKLCETKEVFSNYLTEILMSNIRVFFRNAAILTTFEVQECENITLFLRIIDMLQYVKRKKKNYLFKVQR